MANKIESKIEKMLKSNSFDLDEFEEYFEEHEDKYNEEEHEYELAEFAFRTAIRVGNVEYVEEHVEDFDLNDNGDSSSYLNETEDEEMQELLMDHGAFRSWEDYSDCRFAMETVNGTILAFASEFQKEVFEKYTEEQNDDEEIKQVMELLGITIEGDELKFADLTDTLGDEVKDLIEDLGWDCDFEGDNWKLETCGVYFIK